MAEGRMLKKRISKSKKFASLKSDKARLLYLMLLPHLDAEGRIEADSGIIKGTVCPYVKSITQVGIRLLLGKLHETGLVCLYEVDGERYLEFIKFADFNRINKDKEAMSHIPAPSELQRNAMPTPPKVKLIEENIREEKFNPPTLEEVQNYIKEKSYKVDAKRFFDFFTESGWVDSNGKKVRSWKQKIITWSNHSGNGTQNNRTHGSQDSRDFKDQVSAYGETITD